MFKPNSVILYVSNVEESTDFYNKILSTEPIESFKDFSLYSLTDGFMLGLQQKDVIDPKAQENFGGFELSFSDISNEEVDRIYKYWEKIGVVIELPPQNLDFGYTSVGLDPDGHRLRVCATDTTRLD
ncbi:putative phenazine antibiotic biosynthesis protein [Vibrio nigripulchritudo SOn1]|uniref:Phenazine antibiotic biosynthesis protein n=1 Tax=Vibrio nigripulchritudo SOn1 TaxID=1238450 RepID=A0AAV2VSN1_9VIBR|nr:VOC family protein [Vibrio nigripulchritudo]CCO47575.1 putative phenazine antibiotic biosynthesis protein [Vibrio nigripulchritudo SOn1]